MNAHRRITIPACALVGVIASTDELRLATRMRAPPDLFELRLDHLPHVHESQLSRLSRPLIITARHPAEGGKRCNRKGLLRKFLPHAKFVDVELRSLRQLREVWAEARRLGVGRICSVHDLKRTPDLSVLRKQFSRSLKANANVFKLVTRSDSLRDLLTLFEFLCTQSLLMPICVMAVGKFGPISRVLFCEAGSVFVYAPLRRALYDGQLSIGQLRRRRDF
jgi:3-dehydroquinate dehydratase type I